MNNQNSSDARILNVSPIEDDAMLEGVQRIILRRKKNSRNTILVLGFVFLYVSLNTVNISYTWTVIAAIALVGPFWWLYKVNSNNYPNPKPSYKKVNNIIYRKLAKILIVFAVFSVIRNILNLFNPMHGHKDPSAKSRTGLAISAASSAYAGHHLYRQLKPADYIEAYYKQDAVTSAE